MEMGDEFDEGLCIIQVVQEEEGQGTHVHVMK